MKRVPNIETSIHTKALRLVVGLVLLATCLRVWLGGDPLVGPAQAQIPDAGRQRLDLLREVRRTNELLSGIKHTLDEGTLNVRLEGADNQADAPVVPRSPQP